jgi:hypothetical protein
MQLLQPFNPANYDPSQSGGQLPVGKHMVVINGDEITATKNNDGGMLVLSLQVVDGPLTGSTGPYRLNLYNQSQIACEIAHKQFAALCHVTGMGATIVNDASQLYNKPFFIEVGVQAKNPEYTEVKKVYDINGIEPGKPGCGQQQASSAQQQAPSSTAFAQPAQTAAQPAAAWGSPAQTAAPATDPAVQQPATNAAPPWGQPAQSAGFGQFIQPAAQPAAGSSEKPPWATK